MKTFVATVFVLLQTASAVGIAAEESPAVDGGVAVADFWAASAAEYQAGTEALLERLGARNIKQTDLAGSMMADFLRMFGGGGGAPLDLVRPRAAAFDAK